MSRNLSKVDREQTAQAGSPGPSESKVRVLRKWHCFIAGAVGLDSIIMVKTDTSQDMFLLTIGAYGV
jgi:hypothetical protein